MSYEYLNSGQARACKRDLIRYSLNWFGTCKQGFRVCISNNSKAVLIAKNCIEMYGNSMMLLLDSSCNKFCHLIGWNQVSKSLSKSTT